MNIRNTRIITTSIEDEENRLRNGSHPGAKVEFRGIVRPEEDGRPIQGIEYEAYESMARSTMEHILDDLHRATAFESAEAIHRIGRVRAGEAAIRVTICSRHRREAFAACSEFMDRLKQEVPIWKARFF